ncbi:RsiW-degrading membrane proteinase PrsW (M82 family) [Nocardiopsis mwathae]|uniref:RsiW-degrading membrane proteinase PrsW (M82 family) n=1 Tax=Nocardiopsis mwathae TaxID=1472723 RepID=A0A7X0D726_9ACTN|nr:PrsW family intramembrane metalloprotease [Nocardiopsis mwathae]MBB6174003.1 RsiW-degrading membrane proteinase PrsW (M82 family) [Nocardiopsis mwathae]
MEAPHAPMASPPKKRTWRTIFLTGLLLWAATVLVTFVTRNTNLVPTIVLLGSFLVPVTFVAWAYERDYGGNVTVERLFSAFVIGGILGVLGASLLEDYLLHPSPVLFVGVGLIEEGVKLLALLFIARDLTRRTLRDGLVLGATVGFGFAAFESAGYALQAMITAQGLDLVALVQTEILRGLLAPVGHGLWTAILGGVLFAASPGPQWRFTPGVIATYLGVSLLHAFWDSVHSISLALTLMFTGEPWQQFMLRIGRLPEPTQAQANLINLLDIVGMVVVAAIGLFWLWAVATNGGGRTRARGAREPDEPTGPAGPPGSGGGGEAGPVRPGPPGRPGAPAAPDRPTDAERPGTPRPPQEPDA